MGLPRGSNGWIAQTFAARASFKPRVESRGSYWLRLHAKAFADDDFEREKRGELIRRHKQDGTNNEKSLRQAARRNGRVDGGRRVRRLAPEK